MKGSYIELEACSSLAHLLATPQASNTPLLDTKEEQRLSPVPTPEDKSL